MLSGALVALALVAMPVEVSAKQMTNTEAVCFLLPGGFAMKILSEVTKKPPLCILTAMKKRK